MSVGLPGLLFLVLLVMKLMGYIAWSWLWVVAPLWVSLAAFLLFVAFCLFMAVVTGQTKRRST